MEFGYLHPFPLSPLLCFSREGGRPYPGSPSSMRIEGEWTHSSAGRPAENGSESIDGDHCRHGVVAFEQNCRGSLTETMKHSKGSCVLST